jgi:hypothetical protein
LVHGLLVIFTVVCVFDLADNLGAKVPVFAALWGVTLAVMLTGAERGDFPLKPLIYVAAFVAIPLLSLLRYYLLSGHLPPPQGVALLKGYLLVSLVVVLVVIRFDLVPLLSATLLALAILVVVTFIAIVCDYSWMYNTLQPVGLRSGLFYLDERDYGRLRLLQVYFATSPMLAVSIAYYFDRAMSEPAIRRRRLYFAATLIGIAGMLLAGTRNNIFVALLLPCLLWPLYAKRPALSALCGIGGLAVLALLLAGYAKGFFDPAEFANNIKLTTVGDYLKIFSHPADLWLGQGLGANYDWSARGPYFISELTYFEVIRNFGLLGGLPMLALLALPLASALASPTSRRDKALAVAWFPYLVMSASNPILFSSMGMLILAALAANIFQAQDRKHASETRELA